MRRTPALVSVIGLIVAGVAIDATVDRTPPPREVVSAGMPAASPVGALASTWFCAGGSGQAGSDVAGAIEIANPTGEAVEGTLTVVPTEGSPVVKPLALSPNSVQYVQLASLSTAPYAAAIVDVDGGQVVVEHTIAGKLGFGSAPCASRASPTWYFADGSTAKDATMLLALFNPFPEDAIADLSFSTDQGRAAPADFQGVVVPGRGLRVVNVGDHVRRRETVSTSVRARSGRLVVDQLQVRTETGKAGVSVRLGAPAPGDLWYFPDGFNAPGLTTTFSIYNPSGREAQVDVEVYPDEGDVEPFELTIPARSRAVVVTSTEERVPKNVAYAVVVAAANDVPVVAERTIEAAAPAPRLGRDEAVGARRTARSWALAFGAADPTLDEWVIVYNPARAAATFSVVALGNGQRVAVEGLQDVVVDAGKRKAVRLGDHIQRNPLALVIDSSRPVVVERAVYAVGAPGVAASMGIPLDQR